MPHGWAKPISAISAISAGLKKSKNSAGPKKSLVRTNKRTNSLSYPETVDFVLILVDSKCNFVTCEFVTISTSNNRSRKVILIYNILYIYIKYYYLLFVISSSFLIFLPTYISNLLNVTNSHVTKYNSQNLS